MENIEIIENIDNNNFLTVNFGYPNYTELTKAEKRALLLPLVEVIGEFYKDPENRKKFELWKAERQ